VEQSPFRPRRARGLASCSCGPRIGLAALVTSPGGRARSQAIPLTYQAHRYLLDPESPEGMVPTWLIGILAREAEMDKEKPEQKRILAVDDENDVLLIIKTALQSEGYKVLTATNGFDGLAIAEDQSPCLILLDLMMPEMDGMEVLRKLKESKKTDRIPVIILTGLSDRNKVRQALDQGTSYYIVKPFDYQDLVSKVKLALSE
jgi:CheY-like chemotaxis protein